MTRLIAASLMALVTATEAHASGSCKDRSDLVGECFQTRGRLTVHNGNPTFRIWRVGTNRILGVVGGEDPALPSDIRKQLSFDTEIFADYVVCPTAPDRPGHMRMVCVESADRMVVRPR